MVYENRLVTDRQLEAIDTLRGELEHFEIVEDVIAGALALAFAGDNVDGPVAGLISASGEITYYT